MPHAPQDSELHPPARPDRFPVLRHLVTPTLVFAIGLIFATCLLEPATKSPRALWLATQFAWHVGPWRRYPMPFNCDVLAVPFATNSRIPELIFVGFASLVLALVLALLHRCMFTVVFRVYLRFGWPTYLSDIHDRTSRTALWKACIRRSWWVLPAFCSIGALWEWFAMGQAYAQSPQIVVGWNFDLALLLLAIATYIRIAAQTLTRHVSKTLQPEDWRCGHCGYMLRGLTSQVCPECGQDLAHEPSGFRLGRPGRVRRALSSRVAWITLVLATAASPLWFSPLVGLLPPRYFAMLPSSLRPAAFATWPQSMSAPVKIGAICVLKSNVGVLAIHVPESRPTGHPLYWWQWRSDAGWDSRLPDKRGTEFVPRQVAQLPSVNTPISLYFWCQEWASQHWLLVSWYDPSVSCEVLEPADSPELIRKFAAEATSQPNHPNPR